jgi:toxin ParE1/3/4
VTTVRLRPLAEVDLIARTRYYRREGGDGLGERSFDAAVAALGAITRMPGAGSPRVGELCGIPGLRVRRVVGFPCSWFYFVTIDHVDVVRLVADAQDLPTILADVTHE